MKTSQIIRYVLLFFLVFCVCSVWAKWSAPQLIFELNDLNKGIMASAPYVSFDSDRIFFTRADLPGSSGTIWATSKIYEAVRSQPDGPFEVQRVATELHRGNYTGEPWVSTDGLRLYFVEVEFKYGQWYRYLKMAIRDYIGGPWRVVKAFENLCVFPSRNVCMQISLTADERVVVWMAFNTTTSESKLYTASRPSPFHDFSNITELKELNEIGARDPYMSPSGLAIYFAIREEGFNQLWSADRPSLEEPFGNFQPLNEINQFGLTTTEPCISADGTTLYYVQYQSYDVDLSSNAGIFMSYWEEDTIPPYLVAVKSLQEAAKDKEKIMELFEEAFEKERKAYEILRCLKRGEVPQGVSAQDLFHARMSVMQAMIKQMVSRHHLGKSMSDLKQALALLVIPAEGNLQEQDRKTRENNKDKAIQDERKAVSERQGFSKR